MCTESEVFENVVEVFENGGSASSLDGENRGFGKRLGHLRVKNNMAGYLTFGGLAWTVKNAAKTLVWTKSFLSVFNKQKTEVVENVLVWTGP